ncbi:MAG: gluconokinase [Microbacterium sp.]
MAIVVMGVSGSGKSTVAAALAAAVGGVYLDADDLHPAANVAKMASGIPLTDDDRIPWLRVVGDALADADRRGAVTVMACSALRRRYRDVLRDAAPDLFVVHLAGGAELLAERLAGRADHFMPPSLLASQLSTLEPLGEDETGMAVDIALPLEAIVAQVCDRLRASGTL